MVSILIRRPLWSGKGPEIRGKPKKGLKKDAGESNKVGCRAHFSANVYYNKQSAVEINILKVTWVGPDFSFAVINKFKLNTGWQTA